MSVSGAVEPGPSGVAAAPSSAPARAPAPARLFRPISAEDEEQQPTEIESLCMNCYRNVRRGRGRGRGQRESWAEVARGGGRRLSRWAQLGTRRRSTPGGIIRGGIGVSLVLYLALFFFSRV